MAYRLPGIPRRTLGDIGPGREPLDLVPDQPFNPFRAAQGPDIVSQDWTDMLPAMPPGWEGQESYARAHWLQDVGAAGPEPSYPEPPSYTPPEASTPGNSGMDYGPTPTWQERLAERTQPFLAALGSGLPQPPTIEGLRSGDLGSYMDALNVLTPAVGVVGPSGKAAQLSRTLFERFKDARTAAPPATTAAEESAKYLKEAGARFTAEQEARGQAGLMDRLAQSEEARQLAREADVAHVVEAPPALSQAGTVTQGEIGVPGPQGRVSQGVIGAEPPARQISLPRSESPMTPLEQTAQDMATERLRQVTKEQGLSDLARARAEATAEAARSNPPVVPPDPGVPTGTPPGPPRGAPMPPREDLPRYTHPEIEKLATQLEAGGFAQAIADDLRAAFSATNAAPATGLARLGSAVKMVDPAWATYAFRDMPLVDALWQNAVAHSGAQAHVVRQAEWGMQGTILDAFGKRAFNDPAPMAMAYRGPDIPSLRPYVGTLADVMERAELYQLTPLQRRTADLWWKITDESLHVAQQAGLPIGEVWGRWVGHGMKLPDDPAQAKQIVDNIAAAVGKSGKRGYAKERRLSKEEYAALAESVGTEIDTNLMGILDRRLTGVATDVSEMQWLDAVAERTGGERLPAAAVPQHVGLGQGIVDFRGVRWQLPADVAGPVNAWLRRFDQPPDAAPIRFVNEMVRGLVLTFDASMGVGLQGWRSLLNNPIGAVKDWAAALRIGLTPEGMASLYNRYLPEMTSWAEHGLSFRTPLDLPHAGPGQAARGTESLPVIGRVARTLNEFQGGVLVPLFKLRAANDYLATLQAMRDGVHVHPILGNIPVVSEAAQRLGGVYGKTDAELRQAVAGVVNNRWGGVTVKGQPLGPWWNVLFWTQNWTRANLGFFGNALTPGSPEGVIARQMLAREFMFGTMISAAAAVAAGGKLSDVELDPRSYNWGDINTPFGRIHGGGASQLQFLARLIFGFKEGEYGADKSFAEQRLVNVVGQAAATKMGPLVTVPLALLQNKDYRGSTITTAFATPLGSESFGGKAAAMGNYALQHLALPIAAQQSVEDVGRQLSADQVLGRGIIQAAGFNLKDYTPRMLFDQIAVPHFNKKWADLEPWQKGVLEHLPAGRQIRAQQPMSDQARQMYNTKVKAYDDQAARDTAWREGRLTADQWRNATLQAQATRSGQRDIEQITRGNLDDRPRSDNERALKQYYDMVSRLSQEPIFDTDLFRAERRVLIQSWSPEQRAYVDRNRHAGDTPVVRQYFMTAVPQKERYDELRRADVAKMLRGPDAAPMPEAEWRRFTTFEQKVNAESDPEKKQRMILDLGGGPGGPIDQFMAWRQARGALNRYPDLESQRFRADPRNAAMTQFGLVAAVRR